MPLPPSIRSLIPLVIGLAVGGAGAVLFQQSLPGADGSPEQRAAKLELELKKAQNQLAALQAADPHSRLQPGRTLKDGLRNLEEDLIAGRPVTPEDIFHAGQPLMRALAPLLDRMRVREQRQMIDSMTGELARKYNLSASQQEALKHWFETKSEESAKQWTALVSQDGTRLEDLTRAAKNIRLDDGLDQFMAGTLSGDKLAQFQTERMTERSNRVQQDADTKTERLDNIVHLDAAQRDQVFGIMARGSQDYDPAMKLEGVTGAIDPASSANPQEAMLSVLHPDQRAAYDAERVRRREQAAKDMEALGLSLPAKWDPLDMENF